MPIEIKELVIRTQVSPGGGHADTEGEYRSVEGGSASASASVAFDTEQLVQECVRQVLRVLAQQRER